MLSSPGTSSMLFLDEHGHIVNRKLPHGHEITAKKMAERSKATAQYSITINQYFVTLHEIFNSLQAGSFQGPQFLIETQKSNIQRHGSFSTALVNKEFSLSLFRAHARVGVCERERACHHTHLPRSCSYFSVEAKPFETINSAVAAPEVRW